MNVIYLHTQKTTSYFHFQKNSILSKNTFYLFKERLEISLLWGSIVLSMGEN